MLEGNEAREIDEEEDRRVMQQQQLSAPPTHTHSLNLHDDGNPRQFLGKAGRGREGVVVVRGV